MAGEGSEGEVSSVVSHIEKSLRRRVGGYGLGVTRSVAQIQSHFKIVVTSNQNAPPLHCVTRGIPHLLS